MAYNDIHMRPVEIAKKLGRNKSIISRFLAKPKEYGHGKHTGRPRTLTIRAERRLIAAGINENSTANEIKVNQEIPLSKRRVQQILKSSPNLVYLKRKCEPHLTKNHKTVRLHWATDRLILSQNWSEIIFSDEKKFNLDGPDGNQYYWHDIRKEPQYFSKRAMGGGSLMVWAAFSSNGKTKIVFLSGRQTSSDYINVLTNNLLLFAEELGGPNWIFQQDNASIHTSKMTKKWFEDKNIQVLDWPSKSPDLNPIENLWGRLVRLVYANGSQFQTIDGLRRAILKSWDKITLSELENLSNSMIYRLTEVLKRKGNFIGF